MELLGMAIRSVLFVLDQVTYGLIPSAYELIFYLANVNLFGNEILSGVINRIYLLLGIFMLFKVAFSMIQFLVDPNAFSDQSRGFSKLVTNSLVAIVLLAMTPFFFEKAYEFQGSIILSNAIPRLVLGDTNYQDNLGNGSFSFTSGNTINSEALKQQQDIIHSMGVDVQFAMFSAFYNVNTADDINGFTACAPTTDHPISNVLGSKDMIETGCWGAIQPALTQELHSRGGTLKELFKYKGTQTSAGVTCPDGICDERNFAGFGNLLWWIKAGGNSPFTIVYMPVVSAIAGGYLLLLLISFAIDIAVRVFKLLFLQAIAPIAIISYMDPTESMSKSKFRNWLVECGKTYGSLFLRLAIVYFAILLIRIITSSVFAATNGKSLYYGSVAPGDTMNMFVYVFLILGIFTFAKKVPQMVEGIFGLKMSGDMSLNPFKTINGNAFATGLIGGVVGAGAASVSGAMEGYQEGGGGLEGVRRAIRAGVPAAVTGGVGGIKNGMLSGGKGYVKMGFQQGGRVVWNMRDRDGTTRRSRIAARWSQMTGAPMTSDIDKSRQDNYQRMIDNHKIVTEAADKWLDKNDGNYREKKQTYEANQSSLNKLYERRSRAQAANMDTSSYDTIIESLKKQVSASKAEFETARDEGRNAYVSGAMRNKPSENAALQAWEENNRINRENQRIDGYTGEDVKTYDQFNDRNKSIKAAKDIHAHSSRREDAQQAAENLRHKDSIQRRSFFGR